MTKEMYIGSFLEFFSSNLYVRKNKNKYQVIDSYHEYDKEYNYGVYTKFKNIQDIEPAYLIPDYYYEGEIIFLLNDDFPNEYKMSKNTIHKIENDLNVESFENLDMICLRYGQKRAYQYLHDICQVLRGEIKLTLNREDDM